MTVDLSTIRSLDKLLYNIELEPVQGRRFQPTGFPDLGAATFETTAGTSLLVESAQSMANRMESTCWDDATQSLIPELKGLSYVRVLAEDGTFLTSSVLEAHRINSVYIEKADGGKFHKMLESEIGYSDARPIDRRAFVRALLRYDVGSLIHGTFLESIGGRLRIARAVSAFIEADGVSVAASGGVKNDHVMPGKDDDTTQNAAGGYGNVPFHRDEFTANTITLFGNIDLSQLRGYGFGPEVTDLLILLSLFKLRALVDGKLRLRTACDLKLTTAMLKATNADFVLPPKTPLLAALQPAIATCNSHFAKDAGVTTLTYGG